MEKCFAFVLPTGGERQFGGFKVVYEYANRLVSDGYKVIIKYTFPSKNRQKGFLYNLTKKIFYLFRYIILHDYKPNRWFKLNPAVKQQLVSCCDKIAKESEFADCDCVIATGVETSYYIASLKNIPDENKFYFIQSYETWIGVSDEYVMNSFKLPLNDIVIAPYLQEKLIEVGKESELIPNGFDFEYFSLKNPIEKRNPLHICMLYHTLELKRCADSIAALKLVKEKHPNLIVNIFGFPKRPAGLPEWFHYYQSPNKEQHNFVYNDSAIFIAASRTEGMALPPAEAMICGCALACTNIPGFTQYAIKDKTALLSDVYNVEQLAENICKLIEDNDLRIKISKAGNEFIHTFTWDKAYSKLKTALKID